MEQFIFSILDGTGVWFYLVFMTLYNVIIIPFPNDVLFFATPWLYEGKFWYILIFSSLSAIFSALIDHKLGRVYGKRARLWIEAKGEKYRDAVLLVRKHGHWAVAASAVTPVPFSAVCWACGIVRTPMLPYMAAVLLTRVPRNTIVCLLAWSIL